MDWLIVIMLILLAIFFIPFIAPKPIKYSRETDFLPRVLQQGYRIATPYQDDEESEVDVEPEPYLEEPHSSLGSGNIPPMVKEMGQIYDAQSKSYYRHNGCDVFID